MKIALQIACHGNVHFLPHLLRTLTEQTNRDWKIFILDNGCPADKSGDLRRLVADCGLPIELYRSVTNLGYAGGHNFLFTKHDADYVQILNDDAVLSPDYIERLHDFLDRHPTHAAVSGCILRWDYDRRKEADGGRTDVIDSVGIETKPWGAVRDRYAGKIVSEASLPDGPEDVFGVSGCLPMFRRIAITEASRTGDLFEPDYSSYKEDVDLAFRLQRLGWRAAVVHAAVAWHRRSLKDTKTPPNEYAAYHSYRNHLWNLISYAGQEGRLKILAVVPYEIAKLGWLTVKRPDVPLRAWRETFDQRHSLKDKRRHAKSLNELGAVTPAQENYDCDVAVLMVIYNSIENNCLESLSKAIESSGKNIKVVVVDNGSTQINAAAEVWKHLPDAVFVQRNTNHGFGPSVNRAARELKAKHYFILNPDTVLTDEKIFDKLSLTAEQRNNVGIISPKTINIGSRELQVTRRKFPNWYQPIVSRTRLGETPFGREYLKLFHCLDLDPNREHDVDWVMGSAMFIPEKSWRAVCGFDERFFFYFEDVDLCRRMWDSGRRVIWWPGTEIEHEHTRASNKVKNPIKNILTVKVTQLHIKSWLKYLWKWSGRPLPNRSIATPNPSPKLPKVAIIIPSFFGQNLYHELNACLESLTHVNYPRDRWFIVLAEDFSPHGTNRALFDCDWSHRIGTELPTVHHVSSEENVGFAGINNLGLTKAKEVGCDYVYLLNQDTEVDSGFLAEVVSKAERNPAVGIVQSLLLLGQDRGLVNSIGNKYHFLGYGYSGGYRWTAEQALEHFKNESRHNDLLEIAYASGACSLVRMKLIDQVGFFDERFFMYHEDVDLSLAARLSGWKVIVEPTSQVFHHYVFSKSISKLYWMERNRYLVALTYYRLPTLLVMAPAFLASEIATTLLAIRGGWWHEKHRALNSLLKSETWSLVADRRRRIKRRISDRELLSNAECRILFQEGDTSSPFMKSFANPMMCLVWRVTYFLIRW